MFDIKVDIDKNRINVESDGNDVPGLISEIGVGMFCMMKSVGEEFDPLCMEVFKDTMSDPKFWDVAFSGKAESAEALSNALRAVTNEHIVKVYTKVGKKMGLSDADIKESIEEALSEDGESENEASPLDEIDKILASIFGF